MPRLFAVALVLWFFPLLLGVWGLGIVICLAAGLSDHTSTVVGMLLLPLWFLALYGLVRWDRALGATEFAPSDREAGDA